MTTIRLGARTLEELRDALDFAVEMDSPEGRCCGIADWTGGELEYVDCDAGLLSLFGANCSPELRLISKDRQHIARYVMGGSQWELRHECDWCGRGEWTESAEWKCNCRVEPTSNNPEGWRE